MPDKTIIKKEILGIFERYIESLLLICESEIEKQLFALFLQYIFNDMYSTNKYPFPQSGCMKVGSYQNHKFDSIKKIYTSVSLTEISEFEAQEYLNDGYTQHDSDLLKSRGISFEDEDLMFEDKKTVYELIPQFEIKLEKTFRLDFALIGYHFFDNKKIRETKIAIECDGFEFHSTQQHLTNDNIKNRMLQLNGWKVYRMSGSEIYSKKNLEDIETIFKELRTLSNR